MAALTHCGRAGHDLQKARLFPVAGVGRVHEDFDASLRLISQKPVSVEEPAQDRQEHAENVSERLW